MKHTLKTLLFAAAAITAVFTLSSCSSDSDEDGSTVKVGSVSTALPTTVAAMQSYVGHNIKDITSVLEKIGYNVDPWGYNDWEDRDGNVLGKTEYFRISDAAETFRCYIDVNSDNVAFFITSFTYDDGSYSQFLKSVMEEQELFANASITKFLGYLYDVFAEDKKLYSSKENFIEDLKSGYFSSEDYCWERCKYNTILVYLQKDENYKEYSDLKYAPSWFAPIHDQGWDLNIKKKNSFRRWNASDSTTDNQQ